MPTDRRGFGPRKLQRLKNDVSKVLASLPPLPPALDRPVLVLLSGLPGAGKSYLARGLARRHPLVIVESDAVRKALVKRPSYSKVEHERVFATIHEVAERLLSRGHSVLIDATNLKEIHRQPLYDLAHRAGAEVLVIQVVVPEAIALERLDARWLREDVADRSDAGTEVYAMLRDEVDPITRPHFTVDTSGDIDPALDAIVAALQAIEESR